MAKRHLDEVDNHVYLASNSNLPEVVVTAKAPKSFARYAPYGYEGNSSTIYAGENDNFISHAINQYYRELKHDIKHNKVPKGKYTLPAAVISAAMPSLITQGIKYTSSPFIEGFMLNGLKGAIRRGLTVLGKDALVGAVTEKLGEKITKGIDKDIAPIVNPLNFIGGSALNRNTISQFRKHLYNNLYPVSYSFGDFFKSVGRSIKDMAKNKKVNLSLPESFYKFDIDAPTTNTITAGIHKGGRANGVVYHNARQDAFAVHNRLPQQYSTFKPVTYKNRLYYLPDLDNSYLSNYNNLSIKKIVKNAAYPNTAYTDMVNSAGGFTGKHTLNTISGNIDDLHEPFIGSVDFEDVWDVNGFQDYGIKDKLDKLKLGWLSDLELGDITNGLPFRVKSSIPFIRDTNGQYSIINPNDEAFKKLPQNIQEYFLNPKKYYRSGINLKGTKEQNLSLKSGGSIHINPENRGKFNATKERTGKTTEELTHSKNPLTRKRAIFAQNAAKWKH